ncbi:MAG TPA: signal peptidase I [Actinomycetota bacterium]
MSQHGQEPERNDLVTTEVEGDSTADSTADAPNDGSAARGEADQTSEPERNGKGRQPVGPLAVVRETALLVALAILLAVIFKTFLVQAFYIPSASMTSTLEVFDRVLVEKVSYRFGKVHDGDVIVFVHDTGLPPESSNPLSRFLGGLGQAIGVAAPSNRDFIKRVIGTPGDRISCRDGQVYRNGQALNEPYLDPGTPTENCRPVTIPTGKLYVLGDNRTNSEDSRIFGPIDRSTVVGRAFVRIWPLNHIGWLRRDR